MHCKMSTLFWIFLDNNGIWTEIDLIRRNQSILDPIPKALDRQCVAGSVKMPIIAAAHLVLVEKIEDLPAFIAFVSGGIVEKYHFLLLPCRF